MQANRKNLQWNAHEGIVLCVDWNVANGNIISGGEDCTYKVTFGYIYYKLRLRSSIISGYILSTTCYTPRFGTPLVDSYILVDQWNMSSPQLVHFLFCSI